MAKSLKEENNWKIWLFVAVNSLLLYSVLVHGQLELSGLKEAISNAATLLPASIAGVVATAINCLPSSQTKARLVYLRLKNPLPGHRAFTQYGPADPRVDMAKIKKIVKVLPTDEDAQNRTWYQLYKPIAEQTIVSSVHRDFLLLRDFAALSVVFLLTMVPLATCLLANKAVAAWLAGMFIVEFLIFRQAAANCGVRMVTNVMALKAATPPPRPGEPRAPKSTSKSSGVL